MPALTRAEKSRLRQLRKNASRRRQRATESDYDRARRLDARNADDRRRRADEDAEGSEDRNAGRRQQYAAEDNTDRNSSRRQQYAAEDNDDRNSARRHRYAVLEPEVLQQRQEACRRANAETRQARRDGKVVPTFDTPIDELSDPSKLDFTSFEQNPETAASLFHLNRGIMHMPVDPDRLKESLEAEVLTDEQTKKMIEEFQFAVGKQGDLLTCGACGIRHFGHVIEAYKSKTMKPNDFCCMDLNDLELLQYNEDDLEEWARQKEVFIDVPDTATTNKMIYPWRAKSVEENELGVFHLHPEFVTHSDDGVYHRTMICGSCMHFIIDEEVVPPNSIANGVDFGDFERIGLSPLTPFERLLVARRRLYNRILKVTRSYGKESWDRQTLKGHHILFDHNAPDVVRRLISEPGWQPNDISREVSTHFVGVDKEDVDNMILLSRGTRRIVGNTAKLYQWLAVLECVNELYGDIESNLASLDELKQKLRDLEDSIAENATRTHDSAAVRFENGIGDDTANVRARSEVGQDWTDDSNSTLLTMGRPGSSTLEMLKEIARVSCIDEYKSSSNRAQIKL